MEEKRIHIAAGIILNSDNTKIFITQRPPKAHKAGLWEFPGGKVEAGETAQEAVIRELDEEVGIVVGELSLFMSLDHDYPDKALTFDFFIIHRFDGEPFGKEGQVGIWVETSQLPQFDFPKANHTVLEQILQRLGSCK